MRMSFTDTRKMPASSSRSWVNPLMNSATMKSARVTTITSHDPTSKCFWMTFICRPLRSPPAAGRHPSSARRRGIAIHGKHDKQKPVRPRGRTGSRGEPPRSMARGALVVMELLLLRGAVQRGERGMLAGDDLRHLVEVAGADLALVLDRGEAQLLRREFELLQFHERRHVVVGVAVRQHEHAVVQRMEAGQRDELELVAHRAQLLLELGDGGVVQVLHPVEGRRTVVGE